MGRKIKFTAAFKAKVALEAVKEQQSVNELAKRFDIAPAKVTEWKDEFIKNAAQAFEKPESNDRQAKKLKATNDRLLQKVGQLTLENDFFAKACEDAGLRVR